MGADEKKSHSLSLFLIKEKYTELSDIVKNTSCSDPVIVPIAGLGNSYLYVKKGFSDYPKWSSLFRSVIDIDLIGKSNSISAVLILKSNDRYFVLSFGQGGRFLLKDDVFEERFGLIVTLNSVESNSLRCVDKQSLDSLESHTRIQSGYATSADQFGLDVEQDMLKAVVGAPRDTKLGTRMAGTDSLSVSVKMDLDDMEYLLNSYKEKFEEDLEAKGYDWINNIAIIKGNSSLIPKLEEKLIEKFEKKNYTNLWLSIPEIIHWDTVTGFIFTSGKKIAHSDINLDGFLSTIKPEEITIDILKSRKVSCVDADHKLVFKSWSVFKCLYAEIDLDEDKYILNDGKWFRVNVNFVEKTNTDFSQIAKSSLNLPAYVGGGEGAYNKSVSDASPDKYALLDDKNKIFHGGGQGQVEVCDLFSTEKNLIHVKRYGKSSVFSHLFAQGFVSGQLLQLDPSFREKVRKKLPPKFEDLIDINGRPKEGEFTITYGVISDSEGEDLYLPFFSRVNLNNTAKILGGFGFNVEVLKISVNENYSKKKICPPTKNKL
ncbi:MAG: TIGR04141 family sporadically distributed protein [Candidatus Thiodiazotropha sp. (ex Lucina pensylvanica)]|nr:TIGR04141 family sporadically distributed protein [Candidatus Thiodiazotropha sp. (ex Lucina pensylvanica)]MBT3052427.1 TIGR04141 family sporadically distributed protein [Candidatus Thiodiazotropha sp. (ex Codakia orbicularis)]